MHNQVLKVATIVAWEEMVTYANTISAMEIILVL